LPGTVLYLHLRPRTHGVRGEGHEIGGRNPIRGDVPFPACVPGEEYEAAAEQIQD
jgi:hypothetical protein